MSSFRHADYAFARERPKLLGNYVQQMKKYLGIRFPDRSEHEIDRFVKAMVDERKQAPVTSAVVHKKEGHSEVVKGMLDEYIQNEIGTNNLSPSGTTYCPSSERVSFLREMIDQKIGERSAFKKKWLTFEAQGLKREAQYYHQNQANAKIFNNAIFGGMKISQFILGDKAGFNAITSTGRISVKQGYSYIERAVAANLYLPSERDAITYVLNHARYVHQDFQALMTNGILTIPTVDDVMNYLINSLKHYVLKIDGTVIRSVVTGLTDVERSYVFYAGCLNNLCHWNEDLMRRSIDQCYIQGDIDPSLLHDVDLKELKTFADDVIVAVLSTNYWRLGYHPKKKEVWNDLKTAAEFNPEGLKAFILCCRQFVKGYDALVRILRPVMQVEVTLSRLIFHDRMARMTVPLSDTDSNIFSLQEMIRWKCGQIDWSQSAYEMNAFVTITLSRALEHMFARLSAGLGVEGKDVFRISMKNEFLYPLLIATSMGKHYLAVAEMQEGQILAVGRKDIKGVGFRSSALPKILRDEFETYVVNLHKEIKQGEQIRAGNILKHIMDLEQTIAKSIQTCDATYLQTMSIKRPEEYADSMASAYFYYELWQEVFAPDYGDMIIPNKCFKIPLKGGKKLFKDPVFLEKLERDHPNIATRWALFEDKHPKRNISAVMIPPFKGNIQPFFVEIMDVREHISKVLAGYYHLLDSLGIGNINRDACGLVSDFFDPTTAALD